MEDIYPVLQPVSEHVTRFLLLSNVSQTSVTLVKETGELEQYFLII